MNPGLSLQDKLKRVLPKNSVESVPPLVNSEWEKLGFDLYCNRHGYFLMREQPADISLTCGNLKGEIWALLSKKEQLDGIDLNNMLFLDLETTGLNHGAGSFAFSIGLAYLGENGAMVRQYFLRDPRDERAALHDLAEFLAGFSGLATYNGKSFDWPLLCDRFNFHRMTFPDLGELHLDLLHAARRVWKGMRTGFTLQEVENSILGRKRVRDIPGYLIPAAYYDYLRSGRFDQIELILEHNFHDVTSLIMLAVRLGQVFSGAESCSGSLEAVNAAEVMLRMNRPHAALEYLKAAEAWADECDELLLDRMAKMHKRMGNYEQAAELWRRVIRTQPDNIEARIELAKYYEHRERRIEEAFDYTLEAINILRKDKWRLNHADLKDLYHRLMRLENKLRKDKVGGINDDR